MAIVLNMKVKALPQADNLFVPASLVISIGLPNDDMLTCDVTFILRDDGAFDNSIYKSLERVHKGVIAIPIGLISMLRNEDGSFNYPVINQVLLSSQLMLNEDVEIPVSQD